MDDKLVDSRTGGPPAKRAKISPSLGSDNSDLFERLLSELPDELAGNDVGGKDPLQTQVNLPDSSMQKNQLSQLLSGTSTPPNLTNNRPATVMSSPNLQQAMANHGQNMVGHNSLGNAVKSPITNLNSPPGNMGVNKGIATVTSINDVLVSSNSMATAFTTSSSISMGNMSMNTKPATSQAFNKGSANLGNPNALMNGPHMTATGLGLSLSRSLATTLSNPQVSYAQTNIIGNGSSLGNTITSTIGANPMNAHTSLGARPTLNTSQPLLQTQNPQLQAVSKGGVPGQVGAPAIQQNATPQLVAPGQAPQQTPSAADPEKRKLIQQQLVLLLHAHKCQRREHVNGARPCALPHCKTMKNVLNHMGTCVAGKNCPVAHCASSRQIITHWKNCTRNDCPVCLPLKNAERKPAAQALDGSQPAQNRNPGQVEVARAYEGLGLNPPVQQQQQPQAVSQSLGQQAGTQGSTSVPQIRPPGQLLQPPPGTAPPQAGSVGLGQQQQQQQQQPQAVSVAGHSGLVNANMPSAVGNAGGQLVQTNLLGQPRAPLVSRQTTLPAAGITTISQTVRNIANSLAADSAAGSATASPDGMTAVTNRPVKEWHQSVTQDLRNHLVHKLVQAIFPTPDPAALRDRRMNNLVQYARKVEGDMYETANSREEYYHLLAEKIYKIQKELEEKRAMRMRGTPTQGQPTDASQPAQPTPPRFDGPGPLGNMVGGTPAIDSPQQVPPRMAAPAYDQFAQNSLGSPVSATGQRSGLVSPLGIRQPITSMGPSTSITQATNTILPASSGPTTVSTASTPLQESQQQLKNALEARHQQLGQKQFPTSQQLPHTMTTTSLSAPPIVSATMSTMLSQQQTLPRASPPQLNESQPSPATSVASSFGGKLATSTASGTIPTDAEVKVEGVGMEVNQEDEDSGSGKPHIMALHMGGHGVKTKMELSLSLRRGTGNIKQEVKSEDIEGVTVKEEGVDVSDKGKASAVSNDVSVKTEAMDTNSSQGDGSSASGGSNSGSASGASASSTAVANKPRTKKVFKPEELRQALMPLLEKLYRQDPESMPFRQPVDPILLGIPDYYDIVKTPMDLSAIKRKLDTGQFTDPWQYIDDVWLMFDNAWLYNRKTSRVYKYCSKLAEVFESEVDGVMQGLGYCCGRKHVFHPQVLCCYGKQLCTIPRDATYFSYQNRYVYCEKCFNEIKGEDVELTDDPSGPPTKIRKDQFSKEKNDKLDYEPFVECTDCGRKLHQICVLYMDQIWPNGFTCENCLKAKGMKREENKFISKKLPNTKLGTYLENRVNSFLKRKDSGAGEVTIRVLSSSDKIVEVKPGMRSRFVDTGEMMDSFPYRAKALFAFEEIDGVDVCFFGMHVQEYGSDCSPPNTRRVYIAYLDSVHFFQPRMFRTAVYHEMLIGYLDYAKSLGYTMAHIWACPPSEGDDYIFHCHPAEQPKHQQEWFKMILDKAIIERVVIDYKDILKDAMENQMASATEMAYFEGDFWPNVLEQSIKELETEEAEKRRREEAEAAAVEEVDGEILPEGLPEGNEKNNKRKTSSQKRTRKKSSLPALSGYELSQKLFSTMEKHKEFFFVVRLHTSQMAQNLPPIHDPDPHINCDLMDGRDAFLTQAREKHYEFSSLRRCKFSTMALLYELHNQGKDNIIYTCNSCSNPVETRYHCVVCDDFDLCVPCWKMESHPHSMEKLGLDLDSPAATVSSTSGSISSYTA